MRKPLCILLPVLLGASTANAGTGFFVTAAAGAARIHTKYTSRYVDAARSSVPSSELGAHDLYWSVGGGYSLTDLLRVTGGYEDWGKSTAPSFVTSGSVSEEIYPLTVGAKGFYISYAPMITVVPGLSVDPEIGFLYSDVHIGTNFGSTTGTADTNFRSGFTTRPRYGLGLSLHLPGPFVVGAKYLRIDLPESKLRAGASFFTDRIRPNTFVVSAQYSF